VIALIVDFNKRLPKSSSIILKSILSESNVTKIRQEAEGKENKDPEKLISQGFKTLASPQ